MVIKRHFTSKSTHYWWPRRKDEEVGRDVALNEDKGDSIDDPLPEGKTPYIDYSQYGKHQVPRRVHILGAGNLGAFVAHSLAGISDRPPITLLLRHRQLRAWEDYDCSIEITTHGIKEIRRGFETEIVYKLSENSLALDEDRFEEQGLSNNPKIGENEASSPSDSSPETRDIPHIPVPIRAESNPVADDSLQHDRSGDGIGSQATVSGADRTPKMQAEMNAWFAQAEAEVDQAQRKEKDMTTSEQFCPPDGQEETIYHLIICVKAPQTVKALQGIAHRLSHKSSILFLQNGMGIVDEVNEKVFPNENHRPTYIIGVVSHGLYSKRPFSVVHAGKGTIALGVQPRMPMGENFQPEALHQLSTSSRYLMRTMTRTAIFVAVGLTPTGLLQQQLDKLAVNCIINPLTSILDCKNGALLYNFFYTRVIRLLLAEISLVIRSLPELKNVPNVNMRFNTGRLERLFLSIANTTAENHSSMLQDIRSDRLTEIDYINGYIVKRGEEMGIHCVMNYMLMHMVKGKKMNVSKENADLLPLAVQRS